MYPFHLSTVQSHVYNNYFNTNKNYLSRDSIVYRCTYYRAHINVGRYRKENREVPTCWFIIHLMGVLVIAISNGSHVHELVLWFTKILIKIGVNDL